MRYRRADTQGATWCFTVNLANRQQDLLTRHIDLLREVMRRVQRQHPFEVVAMVEHLHAIWRLPPARRLHPLQPGETWPRHLPAAWPYSSIHRFIERGWLSAQWGGEGSALNLRE